MELWLEGESHQEIAKIIGLPERAIALIRRSSLWRLRDLIALEAAAEDTEFSPGRPK
jgi:DNA-directed RNA polymerase specialized sigma24 family protein